MDTSPAATAELHKLAAAAHLNGPLVLTGLSIGACVARLYAMEYPRDVAGMVIVDQAFAPDPPPDTGEVHRVSEPGVTAPVLLSQEPIAVTVEDISNFQQLPESAQQLHRWAMSLHPVLPTWADAEDCLAQFKPGEFPLGKRPLVVVSTNQARGYERLQRELPALSHVSMQMVAGRAFMRWRSINRTWWWRRSARWWSRCGAAPGRRRAGRRG